MPAGVPLAVNLLAAAVLLAIGVRGPRASAGWALLAALPLLDAALLAAYVLGEDSYRDNGTSRWDAYRTPGGALGPMFVAALALLAAAAVVIAVAALTGRTRLLSATSLVAGLIALVLVTATIVGFTAN